MLRRKIVPQTMKMFHQKEKENKKYRLVKVLKIYEISTRCRKSPLLKD